MGKSSSARAKADGVTSRARARPAEPHRSHAADDHAQGSPVSRGPLSEFAVLLAEVERLRGELATSRAQVKQLAATADIDSLTEMFNRRGFERELKRSLAYVRRYGTSAALFYLDLDGFKPVNDQYGHAAGDAVLKAVASVLRTRVRASDTVARIGGDEFALILWNLNEPAAAAKAQALEALVAGVSVVWNGTELKADASLGVTMLTAFDEPAEALARADYAMYARKAERRSNAILPRERT
jgi:diguanylate cyclase (GGDEF)-like protein